MKKYLLLPLFVLACIRVEAAPQPQGPLEDGQGAVLLHVAQNFPIGLTPRPDRDFFAAVQRVDDTGHETYFVRNRRTGLAAAFAFEGSLPAGRYRITDLDSPACTHLCGGDTIGLPPSADLPDFQVQPGKVSYLGTILLSVRIDTSTKPQRHDVQWGWHAAPDLAIGRRTLAGAFPELVPSAKDVVVGWVDPSAHDLPSLDLRNFKASIGALVLASRWGKDGFYFGSRAGLVKRWRPGSPIDYMDTGSDFELESVIEPTDGTLLAGGEAGELRASSDGGKTWFERSAGLPYGVIDNLVRVDDGSVAFTIFQAGKVSVFIGQPASGDWRRLAELSTQATSWTGQHGLSPVMFYRQGKLVVTLPSSKLAIVDPGNGASEMLDAPGSIANVGFSDDGVFRCSCGTKTIGVPARESRDLGRTWTASGFSRFVGLPAFRDTQHGFGYQLSFLTQGAATTSDAGKTWQVHKLPYNKGILMNTVPTYSMDGTVMLLDAIHSIDFISARELFFYSLDAGEHWQEMPSEHRWLSADIGAVN